MVIPVIMLFLLGYLIYIRKVPKDTGLPKETRVGHCWLQLFESLWAIGLIVALIRLRHAEVYLACGISQNCISGSTRLTVNLCCLTSALPLSGTS